MSRYTTSKTPQGSSTTTTTITSALDILTYMADPTTLRASTRGRVAGPLSPLLDSDEGQLDPIGKRHGGAREFLSWDEENSREELTELLEKADNTIKQHEEGMS